MCDRPLGAKRTKNARGVTACAKTLDVFPQPWNPCVNAEGERLVLMQYLQHCDNDFGRTRALRVWLNSVLSDLMGQAVL
jgi:hypothetical protein